MLDAAGQVQSQASFDPFGDPFEQFGDQTATALGFTGEQTDPNGLVYLRARYLNPQLGAFTSLDPFEGVMERAISRNGYVYVEANPVNRADPSGKFFGLDDLLVGAVTGMLVSMVGGTLGGFGLSAGFLAASASGACGCDLKRWANNLSPLDAAAFVAKGTFAGFVAGGLGGALVGSGPLGLAIAGGANIIGGVGAVIDAYSNVQKHGANLCNLAQAILGGVGIVTGAAAAGTVLSQVKLPQMPNAGGGLQLAPAVSAGGNSTGSVVVAVEGAAVDAGEVAGALDGTGLLGGLINPMAGNSRSIKEFDIVPYKTAVPTGFEKHHGLLDIWAKTNIRGYKSSDAPTIVLSKARHQLTRDWFNNWRKARTGNIMGYVDWKAISGEEAWKMTFQMFKVAG